MGEAKKPPTLGKAEAGDGADADAVSCEYCSAGGELENWSSIYWGN